MVKIAYLLLCHKNPESVIAQARAFAAAGDVVAIHFDRSGGAPAFRAIEAAFRDEPNVVMARRVACGWGDYSLIRATLNLIEAARALDGVTHYFLISGDCFPTKSAAHVHETLAGEDRDYIEINSFADSDWIKTGLKEERLAYRHWFNERTQGRAFYLSLAVQQRLGLRRAAPEGLEVMIGSQWWLLRAGTVEKVLGFLARRPDVARFFRTTWIPDEIMFQTIVARVVRRAEIVSAPPTTLVFSDYGAPVVFYADHREMLAREPRFFARKITGNDPAFRAALLKHYVEGDGDEIGVETVAGYYDYIARRGRHGARRAPRFWTRTGELDEGKEVLLIACKKWHLGEGFAEAVRSAGVDAVGYVFDREERLPMALGNYEYGRQKRGRHRRAFLSMLFETRGVERLALCVDPSRDDVARDFAEAECRTRLLLIDAAFDEAELLGHARRVGLLPDRAGAAQRAEALAALRLEFAEEAGRLRRAANGGLARLAAAGCPVENRTSVARFLRVGEDDAAAVIEKVAPLF